MTSNTPNFPEPTQIIAAAPAEAEDTDASPTPSLALDPTPEPEPDRAAGPAHSPPQVAARLWQIATTTEDTQRHVGDILDEVRLSRSQLDVLIRHFTDLDATRSLEEHLAQLIARQETQEDKLEELGTTLGRLSRTLFKANALTESKDNQTSAAIGTLQELVSRRQEAQNERTWRDQRYLAGLRANARSEFAVELLPALDGLEAVLKSGRALFRRQEEQARQRAEAAQEPQTWSVRLRDFLFGEPPAPKHDGASDMAAALDAWLEGLRLVQERSLGLLAAENIQPIDALGQPFDPKWHVAVGTAENSDVPAGTIIEVVREGYHRQERVLRFAEVIVAK